jgi:CHAP domain
VAEENRYSSGNCTWWAKNQAPWWPNGAGNAAEWLAYAQQHGFQTSSAAQVGALAVWGPGIDPPQGFGHVGIVKAVRPDGTFTVSEMNWQGLGKVDTRNVGDRANLEGFILAPGSGPADGGGDPTGLAGGIAASTTALLGAGKVAGGAVLVLTGLLLAVLLIVRPRLPA